MLGDLVIVCHPSEEAFNDSDEEDNSVRDKAAGTNKEATKGEEEVKKGWYERRPNKEATQKDKIRRAPKWSLGGWEEGYQRKRHRTENSKLSCK